MRIERATPPAMDVLVAVAVAGVLCLRVAAPFEADAVAPDWRAWTLACALGGVLAVRRRHPVGVLFASLAILLLYYALGYGAIGAIEPLVVALYTVAVHGRLRAGVVVAAGLVVGSAVFRLAVEQEDLTAGTLGDVVDDAALATAVLLAGVLVRNHRRLRAAVEQREQALRAEAASQERQRLAEQRLAIARDVHDVVAHALAAVGVQARLATEVLGDAVEDNAQARGIVADIDRVTRDALSDLRRTVGNLRTTPAADGLADVVDRTHGVQVRLHRPDPPADPHPAVEEVVVAVVREALTNVVRHARAETVEVRVDDGPTATTVRVHDDGRGHGVDVPIVEGHGLRGMRERLEAVGGTLIVTSQHGAGVEVLASIPTSDDVGRASTPDVVTA